MNTKVYAAPPMLSVPVAARRLHGPLSYFPEWPTNMGAGQATTPWHAQPRTDALSQLESRSPHWENIPVAHRSQIIDQITRIAGLLHEEAESATENLGLAHATHLYLRHGTTWRPMTEHSDIDIVALLEGERPPYAEKMLRWKPLDGVDRTWHVGYIGLRGVLNGNYATAVFQKMDMYRGVCIFGDDIFQRTPPPPTLGWLSFVNQIMNWARGYLFDTDNHPHDFWGNKGYLRTMEAVHILNRIAPGVNTAKFLAIARSERSFTETEITNGKDALQVLKERADQYGAEGIRILWEAYHVLGGPPLSED